MVRVPKLSDVTDRVNCSTGMAKRRRRGRS